MPRAFDGTAVPMHLDALPCGGIPEFDFASGYAYRCDQCNAVVGSVGMPSSCKEEYEKQRDKEQGE